MGLETVDKECPKKKKKKLNAKQSHSPANKTDPALCVIISRELKRQSSFSFGPLFSERKARNHALL